MPILKKLIKQTRTGFVDGNCWETCVECITGLPAEIFSPDLMKPDYDGPSWITRANETLGRHGLCYVELKLDEQMYFLNGVNNLPVIVIGPSPRGSGKEQHAVVGKWKPDGDIDFIHDPHPDNTFITAPVRIGFIICLNITTVK